MSSVTHSPHKRGLLRAHRFLGDHGFYASFVSSLAAMVLLLVRVTQLHSGRFLFLSWNLFLAWVPYLFALITCVLIRHTKNAWLPLITGVGWLAFFPNAPYLATDLLHLRGNPLMPILYDVSMMTLFVFAGGVLAITSLNLMHRIVEQRFNRWLGWGFVLLVIVLTGFGIYMGRVIRLNSWDLLTHPNHVWHALTRLAAPMPIVLSLLFSGVLLTIYATQKLFKLAPSHEEKDN